MQTFTVIFLAALITSVLARTWLAVRHIRYILAHRDPPIDPLTGKLRKFERLILGAEARGLDRYSPVRYRGAKVGTVQKITIDQERGGALQIGVSMPIFSPTYGITRQRAQIQRTERLRCVQRLQRQMQEVDLARQRHELRRDGGISRRDEDQLAGHRAQVGRGRRTARP